MHLQPIGNAGLERKVDKESGFLDRSDSTISFTDGTRTFQIAPAVTTFSYVQDQVEYAKSSAETIVISDVEGLHFIYYDGATLTETTTFSDDIITIFAFVAAIYWDATNNEGIFVGDERHGNIMDADTHLYNHNTFGARLEDGFALGNLNVDGSGNDNSAAQFSVENGHIWDEDIRHSIADGSPQDLSPTANIPIFYRSGAGGLWRVTTPTAFPITTTGTGRAAWNEDVAGTWQLTEVGNNDFVVYHYYATSDINNPIIAVMGQAEYSTVSQARAGAEVELRNLSFGSLEGLTAEYLPIASVIFQTSNAYSNTVQSRVRSTDSGDDYIDWRFASGGGGTSTVSINWGDIGGTLSNQIDLQAALDAKLDASTSPAYTPLNVTTDRSYNADSTSVDELADVLGTLIADLQSAGLLG